MPPRRQPRPQPPSGSVASLRRTEAQPGYGEPDRGALTGAAVNFDGATCEAHPLHHRGQSDVELRVGTRVHLLGVEADAVILDNAPQLALRLGDRDANVAGPAVARAVDHRLANGPGGKPLDRRRERAGR